MEKINPYYHLLENLLRDLRLTANGFQDKYEFRSFSTIMNKLRRFPDKKLHPETIAKIEQALNIKIDDSDPTNITYKKISREELPPGHEFTDTIPAYKYPLLGVVYAGEPDLLNHELIDEYEYFPYRKNSNRCFSLRVNGKSMETTVQDGAIVLADMDAQLTDGCLVAVKLKNGNQYIKRYYNLNYVFVKLSSDNPEYGVRLIDKTDILVCYRIVMINLPL